MHPARLSFLATKHEQTRKVVNNVRSASGTILTLECGHCVSIASHFDCSKVEQRGCRECGLEYVKNASQYAKEF